MDGIGADAVAIIEFLVGRSQARVRAAKARWEGKHDKPLVDRLRSELHGSNRTLALELLKGERNETAPVNEKLAKEQADELHKGVSRWGSTDDEKFISILAKNSPDQNAALRSAYEKKYNRSLESQIAKVGQKNLKKCLQALLLPPADYYAMRIRKAFVGLGTSDKVVCRVLGGSDKCDALAIAAAYQRKYTTVLKDGIKKECSGNYKRLAQAWVTLPDALEDPEAPIDVIADTQSEPDGDGVVDDPDPPTPPASPKAPTYTAAPRPFQCHAHGCCACVEIKLSRRVSPLLNHGLDAIDATPARRRGGGSEHLTHWLFQQVAAPVQQQVAIYEHQDSRVSGRPMTTPRSILKRPFGRTRTLLCGCRGFL